MLNQTLEIYDHLSIVDDHFLSNFIQVKNSINKTPKGKIYSKYFNTLKQLKSHGLVELSKNSTKINSATKRSSSSLALAIIYCILQRKTKQTCYVEMFQIIVKKCAQRNLYSDTKILNLDFESVVIEAAKEVIGAHIDIKCCFITYVNLLFKKYKN